MAEQRINLTEPQIDERPLVTFALFAYNQEKYIREAVEGAISQTYEPLEIILSDDCSTDRTFEIMQEMAGEYAGKHRITVRRNAKNEGTACHVQSVFTESAGRLFVVAAGDDISLPERVMALFNVWESEGHPNGVVGSGWEIFQDDDVVNVIRFTKNRSIFANNPLEGYARAYWLPAAAPTVAYTRDIFEKFSPLFGGGLIEDAPLFFRAALVGRFVHCHEVLVRVRRHDSNTGTGYTLNDAKRWNRFMQSKLIAFSNMQYDLTNWKGCMNSKLRSRIERQISAVTRSTSGLLLPETRDIAGVDRFVFFLRMISAPAVGSTFRQRMEYALSFFGFNAHINAKNILRRFIRV